MEHNQKLETDVAANKNDTLSSNKEGFLSAKQLADILNVKVTWIYDQTRKNKLPHYKLGKYRRYKADDVIESLRSKKSENDSSSHSQPPT